MPLAPTAHRGPTALTSSIRLAFRGAPPGGASCGHSSNDRADIVSEAIDGLVATSGGKLVRFSRDSHARVVLRADWDKSKVAIVSGGGSGHEPAACGAGRQGAADGGGLRRCLRLAQCRCGARRHRGGHGTRRVPPRGQELYRRPAQFRARGRAGQGLGLAVEMVIVADDIALADARQPRGVAGTVFIHRIAGHMSEAGASLAEIAAAAEAAKASIFTIGAARDTCTVPGNPRHERIGADEVEIGLGIHGEAGAELTRVETSRELVERLCACAARKDQSGRALMRRCSTISAGSRASSVRYWSTICCIRRSPRRSDCWPVRHR